jgi:hypothetical protein
MQSQPRSSHGFALLTFLIAAHQTVTAVRVMQVPAELAPLLTLPLAFEFIISIGWALLFAWITFNLLRLRARRTASWALLGFVTYSLLRLLLFARADYDQQRLPFLITLTVLILVGWAILWRITNGDHTDDGHQSSQR